MTTATPPRRSGPAQRSYGDTSTITAQLRARIPALTPSGQRIGNTILSHPLDIIHMTVTDLADRTGSSVAAGTVDHDSFNRAVRALTGTGRLLIVAVGTSSPLAQDAAYRFRTAGLITEAPPDPHVQHV